MRLNKNKNDCCGCGACFAACPVHAINMIPDEEGFLYPSINEKTCIDCGLCSRVCSFCDNYARTDSQNGSQYYALIHKDMGVRKSSRSGGAFYALSSAMLANGGVVYGVALNDNFEAKHIRIETLDSLSLLQGSKYVQSDKGNTFIDVKKDLEDGKKVFFSGTGCEISGLLSYLQNMRVDLNGLYTCDIVCHGVPSPLIWKENVSDIKKRLGGSIDELSFRDKCFGWNAHIESYRHGKKTVYSNCYTTLFYRHLSLRPSCANCHFCNYERSGDFTIADFWGSEKLELSMDRINGISLLMVHTDKGRALMREAEFDICTVEVKKEQTEQPNLVRPSKLPPERESFWSSYKKLGYKPTTSRFYPLINRIQLVYNRLLRRNK